jgi:hypothetical protein
LRAPYGHMGSSWIRLQGSRKNLLIRVPPLWSNLTHDNVLYVTLTIDAARTRFLQLVAPLPRHIIFASNAAAVSACRRFGSTESTKAKVNGFLAGPHPARVPDRESMRSVMQLVPASHGATMLRQEGRRVGGGGYHCPQQGFPPDSHRASSAHRPWRRCGIVRRGAGGEPRSH